MRIEDLIYRARVKAAESRTIIERQIRAKAAAAADAGVVVELKTRLLTQPCTKCGRRHPPALVFKGRERPYHAPPARARRAA